MGGIVKGKWPTNKRDEFGNVGLKVKTICSFCEASHTGYRDEGKKWFDTHMSKRHKKILAVQKAKPPVKRTMRSYRSYTRSRG